MWHLGEMLRCKKKCAYQSDQEGDELTMMVNAYELLPIVMSGLILSCFIKCRRPYKYWVYSALYFLLNVVK